MQNNQINPELTSTVLWALLTLVHNVLLQRLWIMGDSLVQILKQFTHAGDWDAKRLNKQQQLLRLQILKCWEKKVFSLKK